MVRRMAYISPIALLDKLLHVCHNTLIRALTQSLSAAKVLTAKTHYGATIGMKEDVGGHGRGKERVVIAKDKVLTEVGDVMYAALDSL